MSSSSWLPSLAAVPLALVAVPVVCAEYFTLEGVQRAVYPEATAFEETLIALTPEERRQVAGLAGAQPRHGTLRTFRVRQGDTAIGYLLIDEVIGRQDLITYAVGIDADGVLRAPEILAYRESHGMEIRGTGWRRQFAGRRRLEEVRFGVDIKNIAGATLSSEHVTQGVRWLMAVWRVALRGAA
jgi:hypothetical protein